MTNSSSKIDSNQLAQRMRSYSPRPLPAVQPRGVIDFANRGGFTDILVPQLQPQVKKASSSIVVEKPPSKTEPANAESTAAPEEAQLDRKSLIKTKANTEFAQKTKKQSGLKKFSLVNSILVGMAVVVFAAGMVVALKSFRTNQQIATTVSAQSPATTGGTGEEAKPTEQETTTYTVAADMPRYIDIPKLGVHSRVRETGVATDGSMGVPSNIYDAAWFNQSAKPGSPGGATVIDGHVSGPTQKGVFYGLDKLTAGDVLMVEKGNGDKVYYKVVKTEVVNADSVDMAKLLLPTTVGKAGLNLISCTGKFNSQKQQFEQRALVYAEQIQ